MLRQGSPCSKSLSPSLCSSLMLGALLPAFSAGLRSIDAAEFAVQSVLLAQSRIEMIGKEIPLEEGEQAGNIRRRLPMGRGDSAGRLTADTRGDEEYALRSIPSRWRSRCSRKAGRGSGYGRSASRRLSDGHETTRRSLKAKDNRRGTEQQGFTLVEMLVALVLLGLLSVVLFSSFRSRRTGMGSRQRQRMANERIEVVQNSAPQSIE